MHSRQSPSLQLDARPIMGCMQVVRPMVHLSSSMLQAPAVRLTAACRYTPKTLLIKLGIGDIVTCDNFYIVRFECQSGVRLVDG